MTNPDPEKTAKQLDRIRKEAGEQLASPDEEPLAPDIAPERTRQFTHVSFARMKTEWGPAERIKIAEIMRLADQVLATSFPDAWWLLERLYRVVREPLVTGDGVKVTDPAGHSRWKRNEAGFIIEDWSKLGDAERDDFLYELAVHLVEWEQQAQVMWGQAMFAKGIWEEKFAWAYNTYDGPGRKTVDDKTQYGHFSSMEERYFGIFQSVLSRRADALIRTLTRVYALLEKASR